ncbi:MAG: histidinol dehydrogenase [Tahibacter sp.]
MNIFCWKALDENRRADLLRRPDVVAGDELRATVARIIEQVAADGDSTLRALSRRFDGCELAELEVSDAEFAQAVTEVAPALRAAISEARQRIESFHRATAPTAISVETAPGVHCERLLRPIDRVGLYVPAGSAPLPSTVLMLAVPATLAGCEHIIMCTPANAQGRCDPAVLYTARLCGVTRAFKLGGAQAIAAMGQGTATVPRCEKLFGPGNAWVTEAKRQIAAAPGGPAIDMPAGPSEVLVIADVAANPAFVAADLLSQAEHGPDSQVLLLSTSGDLLNAVAQQIEMQLEHLPRADIARAALRSSRLIHVENVETALAISNRYAPEHLILNLVDARSWLPRVRHAGSVFLGAWSPEAIGDYCSGTNHVLPTHGYARAWSGVSVQSFVKSMTVQELTPAGLAAIGPSAIALAQAEGLHAHAFAVEVRLVDDRGRA